MSWFLAIVLAVGVGVFVVAVLIALRGYVPDMTDEQTPAPDPDVEVEGDDKDREGRAFEPTRDRPDPNRIEPRDPDADDKSTDDASRQGQTESSPDA